MVTIYNHPLISHKLGIIRDKNTNTKEFRESVSEIAMLMAYEATRNFPLKNKEIETPITKCTVQELADEVVLVPILRAGLGMVEGVQSLIPTAKVGYVGLYRDEKTALPQLYYAKFPKNISNATCIVLDPMLATGGSCVKAIDVLKEKGAKKIIYMGLVGVEKGINNVVEHHPDVDIFLAAKDEKLNEKMYIVPGLGDCGDRLFGTK